MNDDDDPKDNDMVCPACGKHIPEDEWHIIVDGYTTTIECPSCGATSTSSNDFGW